METNLRHMTNSSSKYLDNRVDTTGKTEQFSGRFEGTLTKVGEAWGFDVFQTYPQLQNR